MKHPVSTTMFCAAALTLLGGLATAPPSAAATTAPGVSAPLAAAPSAAAPSAARSTPPSVLHVGQIDVQDVAPRGGCEPDTLVEPEVAVSPVNPNIQVAVAHDCRFANGGAVDISYAWTHDGGAHWHHAPLPGLTRAVGGVWARASDPVVAFGPDGSVYVSALTIDLGCPGGVTVSKSTDGGATFGPPVLVQESKVCTYSDDKDWLAVDSQPTSPFYGRVYVFWTAFLSTKSGASIGSPQVVRWSDDGGAHWSGTHQVNPNTDNTQDSQPLIQPDGTVVDTYEEFGSASAGHGPIIREHPVTGGASAPQASGVALLARTSANGGLTWSTPSTVTPDIGFGPGDIRCCLPSAAADPVTGTLYATWEGDGPGMSDPVELSSSTDGSHWSAPVQVTPDHNAHIQQVNSAVVAYRGRVFVTYGTRNTAVDHGNLIQQQLSTSTNGGTTFGQPLSLGPRSNLLYAAVARAHFPGDYIGASATASRLTLAWCVSSRPANPVQVYHQTLYAAVLRS